MEEKSCFFNEVSYMAFLWIIVYSLLNLIPTLFIFISVNTVHADNDAPSEMFCTEFNKAFIITNCTHPQDMNGKTASEYEMK
jgi:hypothetical protein